MKRADSKIRMYAFVLALNLAVGAMFSVVSIRPPTVEPVSQATIMAIRESLKPKVIPAVSGIPVRLEIPALALDLKVGVGRYDHQRKDWTIDTRRAFYADNTVPVNDSNGTTLIYGHAQAPVFARLPAIRPGDTARIYTQNGRVFTYTYRSMRQVIPTDTSVFYDGGAPRLTLQTCIGAWDAYRGLYDFSLTAVEKA